jgi:hypothetical protein
VPINGINYTEKGFLKSATGGSMDQICLQIYLVKNCKIAKSSSTIVDTGKISKSLEFLKFFDVCLTKFKNNQIFLYKISH